MSIPDYQTLMLPFLSFVDKHGPINRKDALQRVIDEFKLTESQQKELLPSGKQRIIQNRLGWAWTYLKKAGLLESTQRGWVEITERGKKVLSTSPEMINVKYLRQFPEFLDFQSSTHQKDERDAVINNSEGTPEENLEAAHDQLKSQLLSDTLLKIKSCSPQFFESVVIDVVVKMGYGGSVTDARSAINQSDEGIDGIINEDRLGLDVIYLQAKKWEANVSRPEIQKFAGALQGRRAKKGIFITTSSFSAEAREYVKHIDAKIILVDGKFLVDLMWEYNVGLSRVAVYETKKLDLDYFIE